MHVIYNAANLYNISIYCMSTSVVPVYFTIIYFLYKESIVIQYYTSCEIFNTIAILNTYYSQRHGSKG